VRLQWAQLSAPQQYSVGVLPASSPVSHPAQFCASGARHERPVSRCEHASRKAARAAAGLAPRRAAPRAAKAGRQRSAAVSSTFSATREPLTFHSTSRR
jgi:hypothetical protein